MLCESGVLDLLGVLCALCGAIGLVRERDWVDQIISVCSVVRVLGISLDKGVILDIMSPVSPHCHEKWSVLENKKLQAGVHKMIDKTGFFYIGKEYSMEKGETLDSPIHYDSRDLTTHAVCIGMTGSGKTGLCVDLLEEATLNHIPSIIIDPKGDMTNLLLAFPELRADDFLPWINEEDARREGIDERAYAEKVSSIWKSGLEEWGIDATRIKRYREAAEFRIFTPGSRMGIGVSILSSLLSPQLSWDREEETLREKIRGTVSALLGLVNYNTDPIRSKEHILLSNIFEHFWRKGEDLSLELLIAAISNPPFEKLGVLDIETFIPKNERHELLLALNSIIASPSFEDWVKGHPLDISRFLRNDQGLPCVSIFYTAHLSDNEKIFFTSLLLEEMLTWVRAQPGTNDLKAILYIDEVFGYMPPYPANPPTKKPLLLLFKQARAFGTGVMLTTQNPVDIDYKALTNAGTWFIGKLQTEQDKARLLEGLETITGESGGQFDRRSLDHLISSLKKRVFIHHNVHNEKPEIFKTRWAMSYLRGPLTKEQIKRLMESEATVPTLKAVREKSVTDTVKVRPEVTGEFPQFFVPPRYSGEFILEKHGVASQASSGGEKAYTPFILGKCRILIDKARPPLSINKEMAFLCAADASQEFFIWKDAELSMEDISLSPGTEALYGYELVNRRLEKKQGFQEARDKLIAEIMRASGFMMYFCQDLKSYSDAGETLEEFEERCAKQFEKNRDEEIDKVRGKFEKRIDKIQDKIEQKALDKERHEREASARKREEMLSGAETVLSWVVGRRSMRGLSTASRKRRMSRVSDEQAKKAEKLIKDYKDELSQLKKELEEEIDEIEDRFEDAMDEIRPVEVKVQKKDITVDTFGILWVPVLKVPREGGVREFNMYTGEELAA
jgi:hypothetical protein